MFRIYPAVDIKGGKCVRLYRGDLGRETVYYQHPYEAALAWEAAGASYLHVVDLDGAAADALVNLEAVRAILERVSIPVQVGGGVRGRADVELLLSLGAERVILGTRALLDPHFAEEMIRAFGPRVIVSVDTQGGEASVGGWRRAARRSLEEIVSHLARCGAERIIHTDITRDGTLEGYDTGVLAPLLDRGLGIIAAGGISSLSDLVELKRLAERGLEGAVIGRALYDGGLELPQALALEEE